MTSKACKAAAMWRQISGMRARASSNPANLDDLAGTLRELVGRVHVVSRKDPVPVEAKLDIILARRQGLTEAESANRLHIRTIPSHTGGKPGTVHIA
jgi:hypothetical protein